MLRLFVTILLALSFPATAIELVIGGVYCVKDESGFQLLKIVEIVRDKIHMRYYEQPKECPTEVSDAQLAQSIPTLPIPREFTEKHTLLLVGIRPITAEEQQDVAELKRMMRPVNEDPPKVDIARSRRLERVPNPGLGPLWVDPTTIQRSGSEVRFVYVTSHGHGNETAEEYLKTKSSAIDARIDCKERKWATGRQEVYSGPETSGPIEFVRPAHSWDRWEPLDRGVAYRGGMLPFADYFCR